MEVQNTSANLGNKSRIVKPMQENIVKALANSIYKHLQSEGCHYQDIIGVSSQLISLVTSDLQDPGTSD